MKGLESFTETKIKPRHDIDGTEIYGEDGQTVTDIEGLTPEEILRLLDIKKDCRKQPSVKIR